MQNIREFQIGDEFARGAHCVAFRGKNVKTGRDVIIKRYGIDFEPDTRKDAVNVGVNQSFETLAEITDGPYRYLIQPKLDGKPWTLDEVPASKLCEELCCFKSLLLVLGQYHKEGFLITDLSAGNVFRMDGESRIMLFDFDSVIDMDPSGIKHISATHSFAPPEIKHPENFTTDCIGPWSANYAAAAILYYRLCGKHPCAMRASDYAKENFRETACVEDANLIYGRLLHQMQKFFEKAFAYGDFRDELEKNRFSDTDEMIRCVEEMIDLAEANARAHLLLAPLPELQGLFIERTECDAVRARLKAGNRLTVIYGAGGLGKSSLAIHTAKEAESAFILRYENSIRHTVARLRFDRDEADKEESEDIRFETHMKYLAEIGKDAVLLLDNYDVPGKNLLEILCDEDFKRLCALKARILVTTRNEPDTPADTKDAVKIGTLTDEDLLRLMKHYYVRWENDGVCDEDLIRIISALERHLLCVELAAKTLQCTNPPVSPGQLLRVLEGDGQQGSLAAVSSEKDGEGYTGKILQHIHKLYSMVSLPEAEAAVLSYFPLLSSEGVNFGLFCEAMEQAEKPLDALVKKGWLSMSDKDRVVRIHPVVRAYCMSSASGLRPNLTEQRYIDFLNALGAAGGYPADKIPHLTFLRKGYRSSYEGYMSMVKQAYTEWQQWRATTEFLAAKIGLFVPKPDTLEEAQRLISFVKDLEAQNWHYSAKFPWESRWRSVAPIRLAAWRFNVFEALNAEVRRKTLRVYETLNVDEDLIAQHYVALGTSLHPERDKKEVQRCYQKAVNIWGKSAANRKKLPHLYIRLGDVSDGDAAMQAYLEAWRIDFETESLPPETRLTLNRRIADFYYRRGMHSKERNARTIEWVTAEEIFNVAKRSNDPKRIEQARRDLRKARFAALICEYRCSDDADQATVDGLVLIRARYSDDDNAVAIMDALTRLTWGIFREQCSLAERILKEVIDLSNEESLPVDPSCYLMQAHICAKKKDPMYVFWMQRFHEAKGHCWRAKWYSRIIKKMGISPPDETS